MKVFAKVLALLWAGWWMFFVLAAGLSEGSPLSIILTHGLIYALIMLASALIALKWERTGGIILLVEGLAIAILYPLFFRARFIEMVFMFLALALPPLVAGLILATRGRPVVRT